MNALELMALGELHRKLQKALDIRSISGDTVITNEQVIHKIKQEISEALKIVIAIKENSEE